MLSNLIRRLMKRLKGWLFYAEVEQPDPLAEERFEAEREVELQRLRNLELLKQDVRRKNIERLVDEKQIEAVAERVKLSKKIEREVLERSKKAEAARPTVSRPDQVLPRRSAVQETRRTVIHETPAVVQDNSMSFMTGILVADALRYREPEVVHVPPAVYVEPEPVYRQPDPEPTYTRTPDPEPEPERRSSSNYGSSSSDYGSSSSDYGSSSSDYSSSSSSDSSSSWSGD